MYQLAKPTGNNASSTILNTSQKHFNFIVDYSMASLFHAPL